MYMNYRVQYNMACYNYDNICLRLDIIGNISLRLVAPLPNLHKVAILSTSGKVQGMQYMQSR